MKVYFRILSLDEKEGSISIRYFTDNITEEYLATRRDVDGDIILSNGYPIECRTDSNISLYGNFNPTREQILKLIEDSVNVEWFKLQDAIKANNNFSLSCVNDLLHNVSEFVVNTSIQTEESSPSSNTNL